MEQVCSSRSYVLFICYVSMIIGAHNNLAIHVIESNGTTEQKEKFLPDLVNADKGSSYLRVYYYKNAISGTITTYYKIVI